MGRTIREQSISIYTARERLRAQLGREPALSELSEATGLSPEEIAMVQRPGGHCLRRGWMRRRMVTRVPRPSWDRTVRESIKLSMMVRL
mgnify:CR=1 FL=1